MEEIQHQSVGRQKSSVKRCSYGSLTLVGGLVEVRRQAVVEELGGKSDLQSLFLLLCWGSLFMRSESRLSGAWREVIGIDFGTTNCRVAFMEKDVSYCWIP
ncbi:hypothetical protein IEQ34_013425 [Dendrobium chrysotoxum]|uniref:Uncharacterized protein n=1 Tax=Dendrobium chrysotoxum TaxID=161865 RepID=A0AAV7GPF3_DENCH|nr:hypothetical protein IEQ34_013425 [Dendrobium chrysotoxum]